MKALSLGAQNGQPKQGKSLRVFYRQESWSLIFISLLVFADYISLLIRLAFLGQQRHKSFIMMFTESVFQCLFKLFWTWKVFVCLSSENLYSLTTYTRAIISFSLQWSFYSKDFGRSLGCLLSLLTHVSLFCLSLHCQSQKEELAHPKAPPLEEWFSNFSSTNKRTVILYLATVYFFLRKT